MKGNCLANKAENNYYILFFNYFAGLAVAKFGISILADHCTPG
jgi:hypothetical protein